MAAQEDQFPATACNLLLSPSLSPSTPSHHTQPGLSWPFCPSSSHVPANSRSVVSPQVQGSKHTRCGPFSRAQTPGAHPLCPQIPHLVGRDAAQCWPEQDTLKHGAVLPGPRQFYRSSHVFSDLLLKEVMGMGGRGEGTV